MKTLFGILVGLFVCASVQAQAPFSRNYYTTNASPAGSINWVDVSTNSYTLGNVGIGTTPITAQKMTLRVDNLTTLPINGLFLTNATPATAGVTVQASPYIYWSGGAWLSTPTSNAPVTIRMGLVPGTGSSTASGDFNIDVSLNNASFANILNLSSSGVLTSPSTVVAGSTAGFLVSSRSRIVSSANGAIEFNNNTQSLRSTAQSNIPQVTKTSNYTIVALDSGLRFTDIGAVAAHTNTLPTAVAGQHFWFYQDTTQIMSVKAVSGDTIRYGATVSASGGDIYSSAIGSTFHVFCPKATVWVIDQLTGTYTGPN